MPLPQCGSPWVRDVIKSRQYADPGIVGGGDGGGRISEGGCPPQTIAVRESPPEIFLTIIEMLVHML